MSDDLEGETGRTHLGKSADPIVLHAVEQSAGRDMKPNGFWYEVDGDWRRWCSGEQWGISRRHLHAVDPGDANLLVIDTPAKLDAFNKQFGTEDDLDVRAIEWAAIADSYDGIEIAPYQWERRFAYLWYYGWDCASGCIWRPRATTVTYLAKLPEDWHAAEAG